MPPIRSQYFPQKCDCGLYTGDSVRRHLVHNWEEKIHHMRRKDLNNDREYDECRSYSLGFVQQLALEKEKYEKLGVKFSSINSPPEPHDSSISKSTVFKPGRRVRVIIENMKMASHYHQMQQMDWEYTAINPNPMFTPPSSPKSPSKNPENTKFTQTTIIPRVWGPLVPLDYKNEWDLIGYGPNDQQTLDKKTFSKENHYGDTRVITNALDWTGMEWNACEI